MGLKGGSVGGALWIVSLAGLFSALGLPPAPVAGLAQEGAGGNAEGCASCHREATEGAHPTLVRPEETLVPPGWPLDAEGRVTCTTCHVRCGRPGEAGGGFATAAQLRSERGGWDFCAECHRRPEEPDSPARPATRAIQHARIFAVAHPLATKPGGDLLDAASRQCLSCHDGTVGSTGDVEVGGGRGIGDAKSSHPIGVPYPARSKPGNDGSFVPRGTLDPRILLPQGRLSCLSCHVLFSGEEKLLVMSNFSSRLCYACHDL